MKMNLFCLPYAGASASLYNKWKNYLLDFINLKPIELPGRGMKIMDEYITNIHDAVNNIYNGIKSEINDEPYAIFGYSLGSWLAFELCLKIKQENMKAPSHVFFAAKEPPHYKTTEHSNYLLSDDKFIDTILKKGGTPLELFEDDDFIEFLLPTMRADYEMLDKYIYNSGHITINSDMTVLNGLNDTVIDNSNMHEWERYGAYNFDKIDFDEGHFFIHTNTKKIVNEINQKLSIVHNKIVCEDILQDLY